MSKLTNERHQTAFEYLTTMPFDELKKLRIASGNFIAIAVLLMIGFMICIPFLLSNQSINFLAILPCAWHIISLIIFFFALRSQFAKTIFWIICSITIFYCSISILSNPISALLAIAIWIDLAIAANHPELWGKNSFTHSQIVFAYNKRKKKSLFSENELPPRDVISENTDKVLAFLALLSLLTTIISSFFF